MEFDCDFSCSATLNEHVSLGIGSTALDGCGWWEELDWISVFATLMLLELGRSGWSVELYVDCVFLVVEGISTCAGGIIEESVVLVDGCGWMAVLDFTFNPPPSATVSDSEVHAVTLIVYPEPCMQGCMRHQTNLQRKPILSLALSRLITIFLLRFLAAKLFTPSKSESNSSVVGHIICSLICQARSQDN